MKIETRHADEQEHRLRIAETLNSHDDGKTSNYGELTLTANQATTEVADKRAGINTVPVLIATTANAAAEIGNGTLYLSASGKQTFTLTHANNAQTDRTFKYIIVG